MRTATPTPKEGSVLFVCSVLFLKDGNGKILSNLCLRDSINICSCLLTHSSVFTLLYLKALEICQQRNFVEETVYLLSK